MTTTATEPPPTRPPPFGDPPPGDQAPGDQSPGDQTPGDQSPGDQTPGEGWPTPTLVVAPWPDAVIDSLGHDPRSAYVERFWLGILGPSTTWLLRRLADGLDRQPQGFTLDLEATALALGLGSRGGRHSPFMRALARCCRFELAEARPGGVLAVRRRVPPLSRRQVQRLPDAVRAEHEAWQAADLARPTEDALRRRSRRLALAVVQVGEDLGATEQALLRWRFSPRLARESAEWATAHQRLAEAGEEPPEPAGA